MSALLGHPGSFTTTGRPPFKLQSGLSLTITRTMIHTGNAHQNLSRCSLKVDTTAVSESTQAAEAKGATKYEVRYRKEADGNSRSGQGWTDEEGNLDQRLQAKFRSLAVVAGDRVEMHKVLASQRSNWNHLFHSTIVIAAVSAASAAAINGAEPTVGLTEVSTLLNAVCAGFMALVNKEQPSQLAVEQLRAARFFKRLMKEIEATLQIDPRLREEASSYWKQKVGTLHVLDGSFPLPLSPDGLEKFPKEVRASKLGFEPQQVIASQLGVPPDGTPTQEATSCRIGWTQKREDYLKEIAKRIDETDVPVLTGIAEKGKQINLAMARLSPFLALAAAVCSIADVVPAFALVRVSCLAAILSVGALFTHSVSHALQLGSFFEVFRNYAGYYLDIQRDVERVLQLPHHMQEDWKLLLQRINLRLGHHPYRETVETEDKATGSLF